MSQKERARAIIAQEYEFSANTSLSPQKVMTRAAEVAGISGSKMRGQIEVSGKSSNDDVHTTFLIMKGPGGFMKVMNFMVSATSNGEGTTKVFLKVGDFMFQKGSLGMKPSINGSHVIGKYVTLLKSALN